MPSPKGATLSEEQPTAPAGATLVGAQPTTPGDVYSGISDADEAGKMFDKALGASLDSGIPISVVEQNFEQVQARLTAREQMLKDAAKMLGEVGFREGVAQDAQYKVPFAGPVWEGIDLISIKQAYDRLDDPNTDWARIAGERQEFDPRNLFTLGPSLSPEETQRADRDLVNNYITDMFIRQERGATIGGRVGQISSGMVGWVAEFALGGGVYRSASTAAQKGISRLIKNRIVTGLGAWAVGSAVRAGVTMPQRVFSATMQKSLQNPDEGWATALAKGFGATWVEAASEVAGGKILSNLPFAGKYVQQLEKMWQGLSFTGKMPTFIQQISTRAGYSNLIGELGEERLATALHAVLGIEDFGAGKDAGPLQRLAAGMKQDFEFENAVAEGLTFMAISGTRLGIGYAGSFFDKNQAPALGPTVEAARLIEQDLAAEAQAKEAAPEGEKGAVVPAVEPAVEEPTVTPPGEVATTEGAEELTLQQGQVENQLETHVGPEQAIFKDKKGNILVAGELEGLSGLNRVILTPEGDIEPLGAGPVDTKRWTRIEISEFLPTQPPTAPAKAEVVEGQLRPAEEAKRPPAIKTPEQIQPQKRIPESKRGPGLTADEIKVLGKETAQEVRFAQTQGEKVGFKQGLKQAKTELDKVRRKFAAQTTDVAGVKQALVDYARKNLPLHPRGKLLAQVKNVKNEAQLQKAIALADKFAEQFQQRVLRATINKKLKRTKPISKKGILKGKFTPEIQRELDAIRNAAGQDRAAARVTMAENIAAYEEGKIETYDELLLKNEALAFAGLKGMTSDELQFVLDNVDSLITQGRTLRAIEREEDLARRNALRSGAVDVITRGQGTKPGATSVSRQQLEANKTFLETLFNWQYGWDDIMDKLSRLDPSDPFQSRLSQFGDQVHKAEALEAAGREASTAQIVEGIKSVFKVETPSEVREALNALAEEVTLGPFVNADGVELPLIMTRDQLVKKFMELQDPTLEATFEGFVTDEGVIKGMRWTPEMIEAVREELTPEERAWANWQMNFYREYYKGVNDVYRKFYKVDMPFNPFYSPIGRDVDIELPESVILAKEAAQYASTITGSHKSRVPSLKPLKFASATEVLANHVARMEHFKAWTSIVSDLRSVFGNSEVRRAVNQFHGRDIQRRVDDFIQDMARGGISKEKINRVADFFRRNFTRAILGIKPAIALKQLPSAIAYTSEMSYRDFATGIIDFWKNPITNFEFLRDNSPALRKRWGEGFERDIRFAQRADWVKTLTGKSTATDWLFALIRAGDKFATAQGSWAAYQSKLKETGDHQKSIDFAVAVTNRTQPTSELSTLSPVQRGGSFVKLLTMFQNQPNKYFRLIANNARNIKYGRGSTAKAAANIITAWAVMPMIFQLVADAFRFRKERQLRAAALGPINNLLIIGGAAKTVVGWAFGDMYEYRGSPVLGTAEKARRGFQKAHKVIKDAKDPDKDVTIEDMIESVEFFAEAIGQVTGVPTPFIVQAEEAIRKGRPAQLIFSQYSLTDPSRPFQFESEDDIRQKIKNIQFKDTRENQRAGRVGRPTKGNEERFKQLRAELKRRRK